MGALHHMIGVYKCLSNVRDIEGKLSSIRRQIEFEQHASYAKFEIQLIFISQLLCDSNYIVQFTPKLYAI